MIMIDTSAWIEFFKPSGNKMIKDTVKYCLEYKLVAMGDLIYCEFLQGIRTSKELNSIKILFSGLAKFDMVGFKLAEKSAENYRYMREHGITVRKTIDVLIASFCIENSFELVHFDSDFDLMEKALGLRIFRKGCYGKSNKN